MSGGEHRAALERDGYALLPGALAGEAAAQLAGELSQALADQAGASAAIRSRGGVVVAARNVLTLYPPAARVWQQPMLLALLADVLGADFGLVRVLYFDKPPDESWSLAWHRDLTIAVRDNSLPSSKFRHPTTKAGVAHVEAPRNLLEQMLALRLHLDDSTEDNGPLEVLPGSHRIGQSQAATPVKVLCRRGDILAMRPLVSHASGAAKPGVAMGRRVLHFEFCGQRELPDGYAWHEFIPPGGPLD